MLLFSTPSTPLPPPPPLCCRSVTVQSIMSPGFHPCFILCTSRLHAHISLCFISACALLHLSYLLDHGCALSDGCSASRRDSWIQQICSEAPPVAVTGCADASVQLNTGDGQNSTKMLQQSCIWGCKEGVNKSTSYLSEYSRGIKAQCCTLNHIILIQIFQMDFF